MWEVSQENRSGSGFLQSSNHLGFAQAGMEVNHECPIISVSKSSFDITSGPVQRTEQACCRQHLRKSVSNAGYPTRSASRGESVTDMLTSLELEKHIITTGGVNVPPDNVIWYERDTQPWSSTKDTHASERCAPCSPTLNRMCCTESREPCCQCHAEENLKAHNKMIYGMLSPALSTRLCLRNIHRPTHHVMDGGLCTHGPFKGERQHLPECRSACVNNAQNTACFKNTCNIAPCPGHLLAPPTCAGSPCLPDRSILHSPWQGFPPLVSSVSETGLNSWAAGHCCGPETNERKNSTHRPDQNRQPVFGHRTLRDACNMTSQKDLREVAVQTLPIDSLIPPLSKAFPEINITTHAGSNICPGGEDKETRISVKEVEWDSEGMTWEVYGAAIDPEELGLAIQHHLELQIKETAAAAAQKKTTAENNGASMQQNNQPRKNERVVRLMCAPACCSHPTAVED